MGKVVALKLVEKPFSREEVELWIDEDGNDLHSLHDLASLPNSFPPGLPAYFIEKYSNKGDVVLDPFCGSGTTALQAKLCGRIPYACDADPLAMRITRAKLEPADLTEVTLRLQMSSLKRPVEVGLFNRSFSAFYDLGTYRELVNLRDSIAQNYDRVAAFIEAVTLSLLHGHSAGFLSVYTHPQVSLLPEAQKELNLKRSQSPDYRAVVPRILRKTASIFRDGVPPFERSVYSPGKLATCDARNLGFIPASSVNLVVTAPPLPGSKVLSSDSWLRYWFSRIDAFSEFSRESPFPTVESWLEFMNEVLFELARVVRSGGRVVLDLPEIKIGNKRYQLEEEVRRMVEESLLAYWSAEGIVLNREKSVKVGMTRLRRDVAHSHRMIVLRKK